MLTSFKLKCLADIKAGLQLPNKGAFVKNESSGRICYCLSNGSLKYIAIPTVADMAQLLENNGIIDFYVIDAGAVRMYKKHLFTSHGPKGVPVQYEKPIAYTWQQIHLSADDILNIAAQHEYEATGKLMGKVITMGRQYIQKAA